MPPNLNNQASLKFINDIEHQTPSELSLHLGLLPFYLDYWDYHRFNLNRNYALFWVPQVPKDASIWLEIYRPTQIIDFKKDYQNIDFQVFRINLIRLKDFLAGVIDDMQLGNRKQIGDFYCLKYDDENGATQTIFDPLAQSIPFGAFAPAECYDVRVLWTDRADLPYFKNVINKNRLPHPKNVLELHIQYTTAEGTIESLDNIFKTMAQKHLAGTELTPFEQNLSHYDAIEPLPLQPNIEHEEGYSFWQIIDNQENIIKVNLQKPDIINWGYDIVIANSNAVNPNLLGSKRPHELVDFIATLHNFPEKPIAFIVDVVYGHSDNQAKQILPEVFFTGAGMYGQELNYQNLMVRHIFLETQRRILWYGVDGFRVDASQDIRYWDGHEMRYDNDYVRLMDNFEIHVFGKSYFPFMIYEDGRPWPDEGWALNTTYSETNKFLPDCIQWGPLTFADNNSHIMAFWLQRYWRVEEIAWKGSRWLTGSSNHDSVRKGTQIDPNDYPINTFFGKKLHELAKNAYHSPATKMFEYFMPGVPMDFLQATTKAPWGFIRNTDEKYGVKVVAQEGFFIDWWLDEAFWAEDWVFPRVKKMGFLTLNQLKNFVHQLQHTVQLTDYHLEKMITLLSVSCTDFQAFSIKNVADLKVFAKNFMTDAFEFCNLSHYTSLLNNDETRFHAALREFRIKRPWLRRNLNEKTEYFGKLSKIEGAVIYYCFRRHKRSNETLLFIGNMEGKAVHLNIHDLPIKERDLWQKWQVKLAASNVIFKTQKDILLKNGEGIILGIG